MPALEVWNHIVTGQSCRRKILRLWSKLVERSRRLVFRATEASFRTRLTMTERHCLCCNRCRLETLAALTSTPLRQIFRCKNLVLILKWNRWRQKETVLLSVLIRMYFQLMLFATMLLIATVVFLV